MFFAGSCPSTAPGGFPQVSGTCVSDTALTSELGIDGVDLMTQKG